MIHYNLWFNLKDAGDRGGLKTICSFLDGLYADGEIEAYRLLENRGSGGKTKLFRYHALIEFENDGQFSRAFSVQRERGIHNGLHGQVMALVSEFQIEVFHQIAGTEPPPMLLRDYACQI
ncbi:MAG TPA: DUF6614 family protein [Desulfuromonadaceae bacterium]|nr:DUF6614 family protein [Desulfuromonadaceae bacterium]